MKKIIIVLFLLLSLIVFCSQLYYGSVDKYQEFAVSHAVYYLNVFGYDTNKQYKLTSFAKSEEEQYPRICQLYEDDTLRLSFFMFEGSEKDGDYVFLHTYIDDKLIVINDISYIEEPLYKPSMWIPKCEYEMGSIVVNDDLYFENVRKVVVEDNLNNFNLLDYKDLVIAEIKSAANLANLELNDGDEVIIYDSICTVNLRYSKLEKTITAFFDRENRYPVTINGKLCGMILRFESEFVFSVLDNDDSALGYGLLSTLIRDNKGFIQITDYYNWYPYTFSFYITEDSCYEKPDNPIMYSKAYDTLFEYAKQQKPLRKIITFEYYKLK